MANLNLSQFTEKTLVADADWVFVWDTAGSISKKVSRNSLLNSGTLTTSAPVTISQTWDALAVAFTALKVNATSTNSAAASLLLDLQEGTVSQFSVTKAGTTTFSNGAVFSLAAGCDFATNNVTRSGAISFGPSSDVVILRDGAANTLALRNGAAAQTFRVYNTYTDASNYSRLKIGWDAVTYAAFTIEGQQLGTGGGRSLALIGSGNVLGLGVAPSSNFNWVINSGHFLAGTDNQYDIGASGANRPRYIYAGTGIAAASTVDAPYIRAGSTGGLQMQGRFFISSTADGNIYLTNNALTDFGRLQFGGISASFPALKRSSTTLQARLADDSAFAPIQGKLTTDTAFTSGAITDTGYIVLYDSTGTAYKVACTPV